MKPLKVSDAALAFPAQVRHLMPPMGEIPPEYWEGSCGWPSQLFNEWFFVGLKSLKLVPREGIDADAALRHIRAIMRSFEPKHEHKEAAVCYLFNQWFSEATWEKADA